MTTPSKPIFDLTALLGSGLADDDVFLIGDLSGTSTKKITRAELVKGLHGTGSAGDVLYHDGTTWARLAKGTARQSLQMNSAGTLPAWSADQAGSVITSTTISGSPSTVSFTDLSGEDSFCVVGVDIALSASVNIALQISTNNGSTWVTTGYFGGSSNDAGESSYTGHLLQTGRGNTTGSSATSVYFNFSVKGLSNSAAPVIGMSGYASTSLSYSGSGVYGSLVAGNAVRLVLLAAGTFTSGTVYLVRM